MQRFEITADTAQVFRIDIDGSLECHRRHQRSIANGLQLHVAAIFAAFEFNHHKVRIFVDPKKVDSRLLSSQSQNSSAITKVSGEITATFERSSRWRSVRSLILSR